MAEVQMPPLRSRPEDITPLVKYFLKKYRVPGSPSGVAPDAMPLFYAYDWPGNVRELEYLIARLCVFRKSDLIRIEDLPDAMVECKRRDENAEFPSLADAVNAAKKAWADEAVKRAGGDVAEAARRADIDKSYLYRMMRNFDKDK